MLRFKLDITSDFTDDNSILREAERAGRKYCIFWRQVTLWLTRFVDGIRAESVKNYGHIFEQVIWFKYVVKERLIGRARGLAVASLEVGGEFRNGHNQPMNGGSAASDFW